VRACFGRLLELGAIHSKNTSFRRVFIDERTVFFEQMRDEFARKDWSYCSSPYHDGDRDKGRSAESLQRVLPRQFAAIGRNPVRFATPQKQRRYWCPMAHHSPLVI
jgi:hypothetical protein